MKKLSLVFLRIIFWFTILGLCVSILMAGWVFLSHHGDWEMKRKFFERVNFTNIYNENRPAFDIILSFQFVIKILKLAAVFYVLKILKLFKGEQPFHIVMANYLQAIAIISLIIGLMGITQTFYIEKFVNNKLMLSTTFSDENYLVLAAFIYLLKLVFQKGHELQSENDLTI